MFNDPEIEEKVVGWAFPLSMYNQEQWFKSHSDDSRNLRFVIETEKDGAIGIATLTDIDWKNRSAFSGIKIEKRENRSKGIGTDTIMALMRYCFDELQLNRLDTCWLAENAPSRGMYKKCGWKEEGIKRKCIFKGGKYHDYIIGGILAEDYYKLISENHYWDN